LKNTSILAILALISAPVFADTFSLNSANNSPNQNHDTNYVMGGGAGFNITQNTDTGTVTSFNSVACPTDDDSYYRRFDLDGDHGLAEAINISSVDFGIESTLSLTLDVNLYSIANGDTLLLANLTPIGSASIAVTSADDLSVVSSNVAGTLNGATHDLVVEVFMPDFSVGGGSSFLGSNAAGQSGASYLRSAVCGAAEPTDTAVLGFPDMHLLMVVNGAVAGPPPVVPTMTWYGIIAMLLLFAIFGRRFVKKS